MTQIALTDKELTALKAVLSASTTSPLVQMARGELQALTVNSDDTAYDFIVKVFDQSKSSYDNPNGDLMHTLYLDQHEVSDAIDHYSHSQEDIYIKTVYVGEV